MTNEQLTKAIQQPDLIVLEQLAESHPRKKQPQLSTVEMKNQLLKMVTKNHPEFWNILAEYHHRLTKKK